MFIVIVIKQNPELAPAFAELSGCLRAFLDEDKSDTEQTK
jgi:hypothetical protein